jgi:hypothetical protein
MEKKLRFGAKNLIPREGASKLWGNHHEIDGNGCPISLSHQLKCGMKI